MRSKSPASQPVQGSPTGSCLNTIETMNNSIARTRVIARQGQQFPHFVSRIQKPTHETIFEALEREDIDLLEQLILDGFSRQIYSWRFVDIVTPKMKEFMIKIPEMQATIERLHGKIILNEPADAIKQLTSGSDRKYLLGRDRDGRTPLHTAILYDRAELVVTIAQQLPLALRACDNDGRTPLHYAALTGNSQIYRQLVDLGAPTTVQDSYLRRPEDYLTDFALQNEFRIKNPIQGNLYHHFYRKSLGSGSLNKLSLDSASSPPLVVVSPNSDSASNNGPNEIKSISKRRSLIPVSNQVFLLNCGENFANENCYDRWWTGSSSRIPNQPDRSRSKSPMAGGNRFSVRALISEGNLDELEASVLQGFGDRLLGETSQAPLVQEFLDNLPGYLDQIAELHRAAARGNVREFQQLLDRPSMILARDPLGATPLHKAVLNGHYDLVEYIVTNYGTSALDAKDNDGRTPLHYAAGLNDERAIYHLLVKSGAKVSIIDQKQKSAEFYLRSPDELNLTQIRLRSQRLNANYAINLQNRIKSKSPARTQQHSHLSGKSPEPLSSSIASNNKRLNRFHSMGALNGTNGTDFETDFEPDALSNASNDGSAVSHASTIVKRTISSKSHALNGSPESISSASVRRWISENNIDAFESAVLEGRGEQIAAKAEKVLGEMDESGSGGAIDAAYIRETVPAMMGKIKRIHAAVSLGDLTSLKQTVEKRRGYILSKDHLGMTPLHKATIMGHVDVVQYILDKFPETVNARDHEGRTALHYSTATTNKNGSRIYRMLIKAGADPRVRDLHGKSADYYRVHLLSLPSEVMRKPTGTDIALTGSNIPGQNNAILTEAKSRRVLQPMIRDKVTSALHHGDVQALNELILDGFGPELLGRTAYGDEARKLLKTVPTTLESIRTMQEAAVSGDHETLMKKLEQEPQWAKIRDANSFTLLHLAVVGGHLGLVNLLADNYPQLLSTKDSMSRTPLHLAALTANTDIYRRLLEFGVDSRSLDQKGKTAEYYLKNNPVVSTSEVQELSHFAASNASSSSSSSQARQNRLSTRKGKPTRLRPLVPRKTPEPGDGTSREDSNQSETNERRPSTTITPPSTPHRVETNGSDTDASGFVDQSGAEELSDRTALDNGTLQQTRDNDILQIDSPMQSETPTTETNVDHNNKISTPPESNDVDAKNDELSQQSESPSSRPESVIVRGENEDVEAERVIVYARGQWEDGIVEEPSAAIETEPDNITVNGQAATVEGDHDTDTTNGPEELTGDGTDTTSGVKSDRMDTLTEESSNDVTLANEGWIIVDDSKAAESGDGSVPSAAAAAVAAPGEDQGTTLPNDDDGSTATLTVKTQPAEQSTEMHKLNVNDAKVVNDTTHDTCSSDDLTNHHHQPAQGQSEPQELTPNGGVNEGQTKAGRSVEDENPARNEKQNSDQTIPINDSSQAVSIQDESIDNKPDTITESELEDSLKQKNNKEQNNQNTTTNTVGSAANDTVIVAEPEQMANGPSDTNESEAPPGDGDEMSATLDALTDEGKIHPESIAEELRDVANLSTKENDDNQRPPVNGFNTENGTAVKNGDRKTESIDRLNELIQTWLAEGDLLRLEHVVIAGQGDRLLGLNSSNQQIQDFLQLVPAYMEKIRKVHGAVSRGDLAEVQKVLTRKRFALCRDQFGASPLHLAVLHGHTDVIIYIITQFPETIDGPDNDGQTPLHYAAVAPDKQLFGILETANASKDIKDRFGYTPSDYLQNGKLTIRELLIKYQNVKTKGSIRKTRPKADLWERPPTAEIEENLTPDSGSLPSTAKTEQAQDDALNQAQQSRKNEQSEGPQILQIDPRPFAEVEQSSGSSEEPLMKALGEIMQPPDTQPDKRSATEDRDNSSKSRKADTDVDAMRSDTRKASSDEGTFRRISEEFVRQLKNEKMRLQKSIDSQMKNNSAIATGKNGSVIDSIQASGQLNTKVSGSLNSAKYDLTQIKDEHGRTVLHLAAAKEHSKSTFYKMLAQAPYLIAERDAKYRTIRDIAVMNGIKANLQAIDRFVLDLFLQQQADTIRMLLLEGYDQVLSVVDSEGNDAISLLKKAGITGMDATIHNLANIQKSRDELHTFIRNGYTEGVIRLMEQFPELVSAKSDHSRTALHLAVLFGNLEIIEKLIEADHRAVNAPDNLGRTPLHYAMAMSKMEEIGRILIHSGANKTVRDVKMRTPTYYFVYKQEIRDIKREEQNLTI